MTARRSTLLQLSCAAVIYAAVAVAVAPGPGLHPSARLPGDPAADVGGVTRELWLIDLEHTNPFLQTRDQYQGAPEGIPVTPAVNAVEPVQPATLWWLSAAVGRVASINLFVLLALMTTAVAAFAFARFLLLFRLEVAAMTGFAAAFNPWVVEQVLAGHFAFAVLAPLVGLLAALARVDERRTVGDAFVAGLAYGACFLTAAYLGMVASVAVAVALALLALRSHDVGARLWVATLACVMLGTLVAMLAPGLAVYALHHVTTARVAGHGIAGTEAAGVRPQQYLNPAPSLNLLGFLHVGGRPPEASVESVVFFGFTTIALALTAIFLGLRGRFAALPQPARSALLLCAVVAPIAFLLSLPTHVRLGGWSAPLPSAALGHVTTYYRVYARFAILFGLCAVFLAAASVQALGVRSRLLGISLAALVVIELWPSTTASWSTAARPLDALLSAQPSGIVADYPQPTDREAAVRLALTTLAYQPDNGHPIYTLLSGGTAHTREAAIRITTRYLTDPSTPSILAAEHVRYVVVHDDVYLAEGETPPHPSADSFRLVGTAGGARVFELRSSVASADVPALLEQEAPTIALVEGLRPPSVAYEGFHGPAPPGWRSFRDGARLLLTKDDPDLASVQLVVHLWASAPNASVRLLAPDGTVAGAAAVGQQDTQVTLGPFALGPGTSRYTLQIAPEGSKMMLGEVLVQPLADYSTSLAAG